MLVIRSGVGKSSAQFLPRFHDVDRTFEAVPQELNSHQDAATTSAYYGNSRAGGHERSSPMVAETTSGLSRNRSSITATILATLSSGLSISVIHSTSGLNGGS